MTLPIFSGFSRIAGVNKNNKISNFLRYKKLSSYAALVFLPLAFILTSF